MDCTPLGCASFSTGCPCACPARSRGSQVQATLVRTVRTRRPECSRRRRHPSPESPHAVELGGGTPEARTASGQPAHVALLLGLLGLSSRGPVLPHPLRDGLALFLRHGALPLGDHLACLLPASLDGRRGVRPFNRFDRPLYRDELSPERFLLIPQRVQNSALRHCDLFLLSDPPRHRTPAKRTHSPVTDIGPRQGRRRRRQRSVADSVTAAPRPAGHSMAGPISTRSTEPRGRGLQPPTHRPLVPGNRFDSPISCDIPDTQRHDQDEAEQHHFRDATNPDIKSLAAAARGAQREREACRAIARRPDEQTLCRVAPRQWCRAIPSASSSATGG